jgi:hypothetical protein
LRGRNLDHLEGLNNIDLLDWVLLDLEEGFDGTFGYLLAFLGVLYNKRHME